MSQRSPRTGRSGPVLASLALLAPPAAPLPAEGPTVPVAYYEATNSFDLGQIGYPGELGRVTFGDPVGDLVGAMFFQVDGEVLWSPMPYSLTSVAPIAGQSVTLATDVAVVPHSSGEKDVLVLSTETGLAVAQHQQTTNDFAITHFPPSIWAGATRLEHRRVGNPEQDVLAGLLDDGVTVRVSAVDELGETHLFSLELPVPVMEYDLIDYDGDGSTEVAVVNDFGMFVFQQSGQLLRREQVDTRIGGVVTFESQGTERLAFWYQEMAAEGQAHLRVVDGPATEPELTLTLLPPGLGLPLDVVPSFASAGDYNGDSNQDLFLQLRHQFCVLLVNQADEAGPPPSAHFGLAGGQYDAIPLGPVPTAPTDPGQGRAFFGNLDSDPGDDLVVPVDEDDRIEIHTRDGLLDPGGGGQQIGLSAGDLVTPDSTYWWAESPPEAHFNLALDVPLEYLPGGANAFEYLQVATWFQDGNDLELTPLGEQSSLHPLASGRFQWIAVEPLETVPGQGQVLLEGDHWPQRDNVWVLFRFVEADVSQQPVQIERATRFYIGAFTLREEEEDLFIPDYLKDLEGAGPEISLFLSTGPFPSASPPGAHAGGWLPGAPYGALEPSATGGPGGGGPPTAEVGSGYVGAYVPQSSSVLFRDAPALPTTVVGGGMEDY